MGQWIEKPVTGLFNPNTGAFVGVVDQANVETPLVVNNPATAVSSVLGAQYQTPLASAVAVVQQYAANVAAIGGTLSQNEVGALATFVSSAMTAGYWNLLIDVMPMCGTFAGVSAKLKWYTSPYLSLTGFVAADYTANGLTGDGSTKWANTNTQHADIVSNVATFAHGLACFVTASANVTGTTQNFVTMSAGTSPQLFLRWEGSSPSQASGDTGSVQTLSPNLNTAIPNGMYQIERSSLTSQTWYMSGVPQATTTTTVSATTQLTNTVGLFADGAGNNKFSGSLGFAAVTNGLMTQEQARLFALHVGTLMYALKRVSTTTRRSNVVLVIGQSLARAGGTGTTTLTTTQPYANLMQPVGMMTTNASAARPAFWNNVGSVAFGPPIPLTETSQAGGGETPSSGALNTLSKSARAAGFADAWDAYVYNCAVGATAYSGLAKGTQPYINSTAVLQYIQPAIAGYGGPNLYFPGIICIHGESDAASTTYQANIRQWQIDYTNDMSAYSGQSNIPIFHSQNSSWNSTSNLSATVCNTAIGSIGPGANTATLGSPFAMLAEHETNPTKSLLVCPKYFLAHNADGLHLASASYTKLGEYYGKAMYTQLVLGQQWNPLRPTSIVRNGAVVTVTFGTAVGNLVLDTSVVSNPNTYYGFEWWDTSSKTISSVAVSGNVATITLSGTPSGTMVLAYAYTAPTSTGGGGPTTGPRGCLRDSDPFIGWQGAALPNYCVHFAKNVT